LASKYQTIISNIKSNKKTIRINEWCDIYGYKLDESIKERDNTFASCYTSGEAPYTVKYVVEMILDELDRSNVVKNVSKKRAFTAEEKRQVLLSQGSQCGCCRKELNPDKTNLYEGDHIIDHADGGDSIIENCICLCLECHQTKSTNRTVYENMKIQFDKAYRGTA